MSRCIPRVIHGITVQEESKLHGACPKCEKTDELEFDDEKFVVDNVLIYRYYCQRCKINYTDTYALVRSEIDD